MRFTSCLRMSIVVACCGLPALGAPPPRYQLLLKMPPTSAVRSVALSPDGSLVATDGGDGGVVVYDAATGRILRSIDQLGGDGIVFSPDGRYLAAAGFRQDEEAKYDTSVHMCDVATGKVVRKFAGHTEIESYSIAFSPDGTLLASGGKDKQILIWDTATGALRHRFADQPFPISALAFSPDSRTLASGGGDKLVRLWDMASGSLVRSLAGHRDWISAIAFSHDGRRIASASCDWGFHRGHEWPRPALRGPEEAEWKLWDATSGELTRTVTQPGRLLALTFTRDDRSLICCIGNDVLLYDAVKESPPRVVTSHDALVTSVCMSVDGASLYSGSHDQTVKQVRLSDGALQRRLPGSRDQVNSVSLSQDARLLAAASGDARLARRQIAAGGKGLSPGAVRLWDAKTGRLLHRLGDPAEQYFAATLTPDGQTVAGGGVRADGSGVVHAWDAASGQRIWSMNDHPAEVLAVAITPDGTMLASGGADGSVHLRDRRRGTVASTLKGHAGGATSLAFSPDGSFVVCGAGNGAWQIWDTRAGQLLRSVQASGVSVTNGSDDRIFNSVGLSQDGAMLTTSRVSVWNLEGEAVKLWDPRTGKLLRDYAAEKIRGRPVALAPDGGIVATGGKGVSLFEVSSGKHLRTLRGHLKRTQAITFSADGRLIVSGGNYGTINAWDVATGRHLITLFHFAETHSNRGLDEWLAYTPEGYYDGSPDVEQYLSWRVGDELQTPGTAGLELHRPDRVESNLKVPFSTTASR